MNTSYLSTESLSMLFAPKMFDNKRFKIAERTNVQSLCKKKRHQAKGKAR